MTAGLSPAVVRHARGRHRASTRGDAAAAVFSRVLEPEVAVLWWISGHPEAVILPMLAGLLVLAGFLVVAVVFAAGGVAVVALIVWREARERRERSDVDEAAGLGEVA